jgi:hypothetical protein
MVSTRAGAGSSTIHAVGWLALFLVNARDAKHVRGQKDRRQRCAGLQAAMMPGKGKMTVTGQPARRGEGIDLGSGVPKTTLSPSDGVRVLLVRYSAVRKRWR